MKVKIFWQPSCPTCPQAKELGAKLEEQGKEVGYYNIKDPEGLSEGVMYDVMATPSIIITDDSGNEIAGFRSAIPKIEEIQNL